MLIRIEEHRGVNLDLVTDWEYAEGEPHRMTPGGTPAAEHTTTAGSQHGRHRQGGRFQPVEPPIPGATPENVGAPTGEEQPPTTPEGKGLDGPEQATPESVAEIPTGKMTLWFIGGREKTYEGPEAARLQRYFASRGGVLG